MSGPPLDAAERAALCDRFEALGPEAPTLCEGWTTLDLAAHLVVRERNPMAGPGILVGGPFGAYTERARQRAAERDYGSLIATLRAGPPAPWRLPGLRAVLNLNEWFVHHEDVRRANGDGPRPGPEALQEALWGMLRRGARLQVRKVRGVGVELRTPDGASTTAKRGDPVVTLTGAPGELVLYLNGRKAAAEVQLDGPADAVRVVADAPMGV